MKAMAVAGEGFEVAEVETPAVGAGTVRVRVVAAALNPADAKVRNGEFAGRFLHAQVQPLVLGFDVSGIVDACGEGVDDLQEGDAVYGHLPYASSTTQGTLAQYVTVDADALGRKPDGVSHATAAAAATVGLTALQALRDVASVGEGKRVLVIGAGGGVGSLAVGIGQRLGAAVVGVCSPKDVARVEALGADEILDRTTVDLRQGPADFDAILDTPAAHTYGALARRLAPGGTYVTTLPGPSLVLGMLRALFSSKHCSVVVVHSRRADLEALGAWLDDGLVVAVDGQHPVRELGAAFERLAARDATGRVVVDIADGW
jgi:NADPH:quinone reductase-like Zn-dependent oxidoreductase